MDPADTDIPLWKFATLIMVVIFAAICIAVARAHS